MYAPRIEQVEHLQLSTEQIDTLKALISLSGQYETELFCNLMDDVANSSMFEGDLWETVNMCLGWA